MSINEVQANGWTAVPVDGKKIIDQLGGVKETAAIKLEEIHFPSDVPLVKEAQLFAKQKLSPEAFNHSMRVFYWGAFQFP
jgi:cyanamide hydratase